MPYVGGSLVDWVQAGKGTPTRTVMRQVAGAVGDEMTRRAAMHTPQRTGDLASRWRSLEVEISETGGYQSGTENPSPVAHLIEYGVDPHDLKPKRAGALDTPEGPRAAAHHPGFGGAHMLARAVEEIDLELELIARPYLSEWAATVEHLQKRHRGID